MNENETDEGPDPELGTESKLSKNKKQPRSQLTKVIFKILSWIGFALLTILAIVIGILVLSAFIVIMSGCMVIGVAVSIPLLLVMLVAIRLVQYMRNGEENANVTQVKLWARTWLCMAMTGLLVMMGILKVFAILITSLKHGMILGVPLSKWINLVSMICGFHQFSYALLIVPRVMLDAFNGYVIPEAVLEIVDCLIFWWAEYEVIKRVPTFKTHKLLGLKTQKWIKHTLFILIGINVIELFTKFLVWSMRKWFVRNWPQPKGLKSQSLLTDKVHPGVGESQSPITDQAHPRDGDIQSPQTDQAHPEVVESQLPLTDKAHSAVIKSRLPKTAEKAHHPGVKESLTDKVLPRKYLLYYANGMRANISFLLATLMVLLTWVLYFGPHLSGENEAQSVVRFGTWTFLSLAIFSSLCVLKTFVLLSWEVHAIYIRLSSKILKAGKQLYFLGIITRHNCDIFNLLYIEARVKEQDLSCSADLAGHFFRALAAAGGDFYGRRRYDEVDEWDTGRKLAHKKRKKLRGDLLLPNDGTATIYEILQVAQSFLATRYALSKDMYIPHILQTLTTTHNSNNIDGTNLRRLVDGENNLQDSHHQDSSEEKNLAHHDSNVTSNSVKKKRVSKQDSAKEDTKKKQTYNDFEELLKHANFTNQLTSQDFQSWMEKARVNCLIIGNILSNAKEAVECLDKIISWVLIGGTFILWLILTGLASTEVLVLIASPLLAATFIFGDTCKSFFQGIMFVYVVHPFDVGDLCAIDEKLMEVKSIGVWKTTFSNVDKIGGQEEVIFPNSELANKVVINHKSEFDCNDYLQFQLAELQDDNKIEELIRRIEGLLSIKNGMFTSGSHSVALLTTEEDMKITVRFRHNIKPKDAAYFEYLRTKEKQRTALILHIQKIVNELTNKSSEQAREDTKDSGKLLINSPEIQPYRSSELK